MSARVELEWLTPLPWADPPFEIVQRIHRARRGVSQSAHEVSAEFHRRLAAAGILVEGA